MTSPAAKRPNLVIVFPDQMRGQALGFLGEDPVVTPHLDRFARESLVLTDAVANYPICSPFRGMFMTGQYPVANGVIHNCNSRSAPHGCELRADQQCWSDVLHDHGYHLNYIGKWHLDAPVEPYIPCQNNLGPVKWNEWCPPERRHGFGDWYAYGTYDYHLRPMYWTSEAPRNGFHFVEQWGPEHEADRAVAFLRNTGGRQRDPDQPFALVVAMNPPHTPYDQLPARYLEPYAGRTDEELLVRANVDRSGATEMSRLALRETRNYFANITGVDDQFGRILQAIDEAGLSDDTLVLFTSDHGDCVGTHDEVTKDNPYEESMRVPFLLRWPGRIAPRHDDLLFSTPDLHPTLLDLLGLAAAIPATVQGTSHAPLFLSGTGPRPTSQLYLKMALENPLLGTRGVRSHAHKLAMTADAAGRLTTRLYDRRTDPDEINNIALQAPAVVQQLIHDELRPWLTRTGDPWIKNLN